MTSLPLTVLSQTKTTITLGWPAVPGAEGFEFLVDGKRSNTWDGTSTSARFSSSAKKIVVNALAVSAQGTYPSVSPPSGNGSVGGVWFTGQSPWNTPVGANPQIDQNSVAYMKLLAGMGIFWNGSPAASGGGSTPVYLADASTPIVNITVQRGGVGAVPLPYKAGWNTAGVDEHLAVLRTDTGAYWESQGFDNSNPANLKVYAVAQGNVITGQGVPTTTQNISVLPTVGGLIRPQFVGAGVRIPFALRVAIPCSAPMPNGFRAPAIYTDGGTTNGIPSGARLWLPSVPSGLDPFQTQVAVCLNTYGMLVGDSNGDSPSISGYVQSTVDGSTYSLPLTSFPASVVAQMHVLAA